MLLAATARLVAAQHASYAHPATPEAACLERFLHCYDYGSLGQQIAELPPTPVEWSTSLLEAAPAARGLLELPLDGFDDRPPPAVATALLDFTRRTLALLWFGAVVGLAASGLTLLYAARRTDAAGRRLVRLETAGLSGARQRRLLALCWSAYWASLFGALACYAAAFPRSLGWGGGALRASFGLLRLCLLLASGCLAGALLPLLSHVDAAPAHGSNPNPGPSADADPDH
mgnify:CR=1 FL=1